MSINFSTLQGLTIPEGVVTQIADASGRVMWSAMTLVASWDVSAAQDGSIIASACSKLGNADEYSLSIKGTGAMMDWETDATSDFHDSAYKDKITRVTIGEGVTTIGRLAFRNFTNLSGIVIPASVASIGMGAFQWCSGLTGTLTIPEGVTQIGVAAFQHTGITGLIIPASVTTMQMRVFGDCDSLTEITFKHTSADTLNAINAQVFIVSSVMDTTVYVPDVGNIHAAISGYDWSGNNRTVTYANI